MSRSAFEEMRNFYIEDDFRKLARLNERIIVLEALRTGKLLPVRRLPKAVTLMESKEQYDRYEAFHLLEYAFSTLETERTTRGVKFGQLSKADPTKFDAKLYFDVFYAIKTLAKELLADLILGYNDAIVANVSVGFAQGVGEHIVRYIYGEDPPAGFEYKRVGKSIQFHHLSGKVNATKLLMAKWEKLKGMYIQGDAKQMVEQIPQLSAVGWLITRPKRQDLTQMTEERPRVNQMGYIRMLKMYLKGTLRTLQVLLSCTPLYEVFKLNLDSREKKSSRSLTTADVERYEPAIDKAEEMTSYPKEVWPSHYTTDDMATMRGIVSGWRDLTKRFKREIETPDDIRDAQVVITLALNRVHTAGDMADYVDLTVEELKELSNIDLVKKSARDTASPYSPKTLYNMAKKWVKESLNERL